jgi:hypothetical protein
MTLFWPFIAITLCLTALLGYIMATMEKNTIIKNWSKNRCRIPVMFTASYFKPPDDPRTPSEFSSDNFNFCMKEAVTNFVELMMAPFIAIFGKNVDSANGMQSVLNDIRMVIKTLYDSFLSFFEPFYRKYIATIFQVSKITQHMRMLFRRVNTIAIGLLFSGLSIVRGMLNFRDFIIKVVLIILGIMLAMIILLFFILLPTMPLIMSVVGIVATVIGSAAAAQYQGIAGCFPESTIIKVIRKRKTKNGLQQIYITDIPIKDIQIGDILEKTNSIVEGIIELDGKDVQLYNIDGIYVSGSHLVKNEKTGEWIEVKDYDKAYKVYNRVQKIYCLNTSNRYIPIKSPITDNYVYFRDWEELNEHDQQGLLLWHKHVLELLNIDKNTESAILNSQFHNDSYYALPEYTRVFVYNKGFIHIKHLQIGDYILDRHNEYTKVIGLHMTKTTSSSYPVIYWDDNTNYWIRRIIPLHRTSNDIHHNSYFYMPITVSGTLYAHINNKHILIRDFTEVGIHDIHKTYAFTSDRLRISEKNTYTTDKQI